jgi:hypothetical protein
MWFVLRDRKPVRVETLTEWVDGMTEKNAADLMRIGLDAVGSAIVSTIFLGIAGDLGGEPRPYETAIFEADAVRVVGRAATWKQAEAMHRQTVNDLQAVM